VIRNKAESFFLEVVKIHGFGRHFSMAPESDGETRPRSGT